MNKWEKEVQESLLSSEQECLTVLQRQYKAATNAIMDKVKVFNADIADIDNAIAAGGLSQKEIDKLLSIKQSKIYQRQYQEQLYGQVSGILDKMQSDNYSTIDGYLKTAYEDAYLGTMYDIEKQLGVPIIAPINQASVTRAVLLDSKISTKTSSKVGALYDALGVDNVKKKITEELSRGIATGASYVEISRNLGNAAGIGYNNAARIVRTEGHRIQQAATSDAQHVAKKKGADILKQWDAALDVRTREDHRILDGQIRELDEDFEVNGNKAERPGYFGIPAEDINCRCACLTRARWALDQEELDELEFRAAAFGIDKTTSFEEFKIKYIDIAKVAPQATTIVKKEYLTEKKLKEKISDLDDQEKQLLSGFKDQSDFDLNATAQQKLDMLSIQNKKQEYQDKLDQKLVKKEKKALTKQQIDLEDKIQNTDIKTYSGIWKNQDVTTDQWSAYKDSIQKKKQYYENKLLYATDPNEIKQLQEYIAQLDEFDAEGKALFDLQSNLSTVKGKLNSLSKNGIINAPDDAFSADRKNNALWTDNFRVADAYYDPPAKILHQSATKREHDGFYTYTQASGGHNRPLAGFEKPWSQGGSGWEQKFFKGSGNVWIDYEGKGDQIRGLTTLIQKSTYDQDVWLQSGQGLGTMAGFLGISESKLAGMSDAELQQFVGRRGVIPQFISTSVIKGGGAGFNSSPSKLNIYAPKGSQMLYASDVGAYGKGENEMILQRGGTYEITKLYWGTDSTQYSSRKVMFFDLDIHPEAGYDFFQQDPNEWTGSKTDYRGVTH